MTKGFVVFVAANLWIPFFWGFNTVSIESRLFGANEWFHLYGSRDLEKRGHNIVSKSQDPIVRLLIVVC
jgi:hypothetical protein